MERKVGVRESVEGKWRDVFFVEMRWIFSERESVASHSFKREKNNNNNIEQFLNTFSVKETKIEITPIDHRSTKWGVLWCRKGGHSRSRG